MLATAECLSRSHSKTHKVLAKWFEDADGLPACEYLGDLPWTAKRPDGAAAHLHPDPYFLLGNHRFALFPHVSGSYRLFATERGTSLVNPATPGTGDAGASLQVQGLAEHALTGLDGLASRAADCRRTFGIGFANWAFPDVDEIKIQRTISVRPSRRVGEGPAAAVIDVTLTNCGTREKKVTYREWLTVRYGQIYHLNRPDREPLVRYSCRARAHDRRLLVARIVAKPLDPALDIPRNRPCLYDLFPPSVFLGFLTDTPGAHVSRHAAADDGERMQAAVSASLAPGESRTIRIAVGITHQPRTLEAGLTAWAADFRSQGEVHGGAFGPQWAALIPALDTESNREMRREMRWHAGTLHALVRYQERYQGVYLPQSGSYDYLIGFNSVPRDFAQHLLPLCRLAPEIARAAVLVQFRRMTAEGSWSWSEIGANWPTDFHWTSSDLQLYSLLALAEYLDATGDTDILAEKASVRGSESLLDRVHAAYRYLVDEVGTGSHGLIRLLGGDWNDALTSDRPLGKLYWGAESHLNSAIAIEVFRRIPQHLERFALEPGKRGTPRAKRLAESMRRFRAAQFDAFMSDWGDAPFPARFHVSDTEVVGRESLYLEPLGFLLRQPDLPIAKRRRLLVEIERRLGNHEPLGFRCREMIDRHPGSHFKPGCQENGAVWWALVGGTIWGAAATDPAWARRTLEKTNLTAFARAYPDFWLGQWTSMDCFNSSAAAAPGLGYDDGDFALCGGFTTHPHAWLLFCHQHLQKP